MCTYAVLQVFTLDSPMCHLYAHSTVYHAYWPVCMYVRMSVCQYRHTYVRMSVCQYRHTYVRTKVVSVSSRAC